MPGKKLSIGFATLSAIFAVTILMMATHAAAQTETVLFSFSNANTPAGGLISDALGNLYGTTLNGGTGANCDPELCGVVFELSPTVEGGWKAKILHSFTVLTPDGWAPVAGLIFDHAGNLYGTTVMGGTYGQGTVFELSLMKNGSWTEKILHNFGHGEDGTEPATGLILDAAGNLYGTTSAGGIYDSLNTASGIVFKLTKMCGGWTEEILHNFGHGEDVGGPAGSLIFDASGNLYGATSATVFELTSEANGTWTEKILHKFGSIDHDGAVPVGSLIFDASGNLYGTTQQGGLSSTPGDGTVFELSPSGSGAWEETILHNFQGIPTDGWRPLGGVIFDTSGNLYGTTFFGGTPEICPRQTGCGTVFELTPAGGGVWNETILHKFQDSPTDGAGPDAGLILDASGNLFGTTAGGGKQGKGTVFEITP
jgi:uncharacterized repeat protein (TIGR03803 family)